MNPTILARHFFPHLTLHCGIRLISDIVVVKLMQKGAIVLANSQDRTDDSPYITIANEAIGDDGWALVAPFGEHLNTRRVKTPSGGVETQKYIQVLDREAADDVLANEEGLLRRLKLATVGMPVFKGHPDYKDYEPSVLGNDYGKPVKLGVVDKLRKSDRGIEAHFIITRDSATVVANEGHKYPSVLWRVMPKGERDGAVVVSPFQILSVALTDRPNIFGVDALANARPQQPAATTEPKHQNQMKAQLTGWLAAQGITLANDASDGTVLDAVQRRFSDLSGQITTLSNERNTLKTENATLITERDGLKTKNTEAATTLGNAQTLFKTERTARIAGVIDLAIQQGKISVADREKEITTLGNAADFDASVTEITKRQRKFKVAAEANEGKALANAQMANPRDLFLGKVNEKMAGGKMNYRQAASAVMAENPAIKEAMGQSRAGQ